MSKRKTEDAEIQMVVRSINYISRQVDLIKMTKTWSDEDFLYAIERIEIDLPEEKREEVRGLYWNLRMERQAADAFIASEEANARRHGEISHRLEDLEKTALVDSSEFLVPPC